MIGVNAQRHEKGVVAIDGDKVISDFQSLAARRLLVVDIIDSSISLWGTHATKPRSTVKPRDRASRSAHRRERDRHRPPRGRCRTSPTGVTGCAKLASKRCFSDLANCFFGESNSS